jgi:hypothetical protein
VAKYQLDEKNESLNKIVVELKKTINKVVMGEQNELCRLKRQLDELTKQKQFLERESETRIAKAIIQKVDDIRLTEQ